MAHPDRQAKAEQITLAIDDFVRAYIAAKIHMATNDEPLNKARQVLADVLATAIK